MSGTAKAEPSSDSNQTHLSRTLSAASTYAQNSLQQTALQEVGYLSENDVVTTPLPSSEIRYVGDEEKGVEVINAKVELQDQTNLLPFRQVIIVCSGLTCALFCSLLDQTM